MYFTDGFGEYPKKPTDYDTAFVFWKDEELDDTGVPDWAIKLFLEPDEDGARVTIAAESAVPAGSWA